MNKVGDLFDPIKGKGAYLSEVAPGKTPLISATAMDNGIVAFVDLEPTFKAPAITVGRVAGSAFVQLDDFATVPDDMAVLEPKRPMTVEELYVVAALINRESWRFSYYRKLTPNRLRLLEIPFDEAMAVAKNIPALELLKRRAWRVKV